MNEIRNRHTPELVDEENDIYECTKCGKRGRFKGDFYDDCISDDTSGPKDNPDEGSLLRGIFNTFGDKFYDRNL